MRSRRSKHIYNFVWICKQNEQFHMIFTNSEAYSPPYRIDATSYFFRLSRFAPGPPANTIVMFDEKQNN